MSSRTAIVTGAGSGIGKAVAHALLADGWNVVFCGRRTDRLPVIEEAEAGSARGLAQACDVSKAADVTALFEVAIAAFGRVDLLFNNAGASHPYAMIDEVPVDA